MPDIELKPQVYRDPRPAEDFDRYHALVRDHEPETRVYEPTRILTALHALITFRARALYSENVPNGPVILAPNHASFMDHFFAGVFIRRRVQFMGKSQLFKGVGAWSSRTGKIADEARPGIGRLALESGVPVVPVAILGSYQLRNWRRGTLPKVTVRYGEPFRLARVDDPSRELQQAAADLILERIRALHAELERQGHRGALRASRGRFQR